MRAFFLGIGVALAAFASLIFSRKKVEDLERDLRNKECEDEARKSSDLVESFSDSQSVRDKEVDFKVSEEILSNKDKISNTSDGEKYEVKL